MLSGLRILSIEYILLPVAGSGRYDAHISTLLTEVTSYTSPYNELRNRFVLSGLTLVQRD